MSTTYTKEVTSIPTPISFGTNNPSGETNIGFARWFQAVGAGNVVAKNENGDSVTFSVSAGEIIPGVFREITAMTCSSLRYGNGAPPPITPTSQSAAGVALADAGGYTAETDLEGAVEEVYGRLDAIDVDLAAADQHLLTAHAVLPISLAAAILADGTPMAAWADSATSDPGVTLANAKAVGVRWNNAASQIAIWSSVLLPLDLDPAAAMTLKVMASKTGATVGDATTFDIAAFGQTEAALHDAGADLGDTTDAMVGNATAKTVQVVSIAIAVPPTPPASLSLSIQPTDGTLGTDDVIVEAVWIEYQRKLQTS